MNCDWCGNLITAEFKGTIAGEELSFCSSDCFEIMSSRALEIKGPGGFRSVGELCPDCPNGVCLNCSTKNIERGDDMTEIIGPISMIGNTIYSKAYLQRLAQARREAKSRTPEIIGPLDGI